MKAARILLAAGASGSGKTLITCGLLQALVNRGLKTASFKCGPDYIDPMFHRIPFLQTLKLQNISSVKMRWTVIFLLWKE